jgi:hypothetical protein
VRTALLAAVLAAAGWLAAPAQAGTYTVYACTAAGHKWGNRSWTARSAKGIVTDTECDKGKLIGIRIDAGATIPSGTVAGLTFTSPPWTSITGFTVDRQLDYNDSAVSGTHQLYTLYQLGDTVFAGAGDYDDATRSALNAQHSWYGYPPRRPTWPAAPPRCATSARSAATAAAHASSTCAWAAFRAAAAPARSAPAGASTTSSTARR